MQNPFSKTHGIYKNLSGDTVFNSQAAMLVFTTGIAFNLSAAPGMLSEEFGSTTFWAFIAYSVIDVALTTLVFLFARKNGDAYLSTVNCFAYRLVCLLAMIFLTFKGVFHFSYASSFLTHELFEGLEPSLIYLLFLLPVVYLGAKGMRTISRTTEIFFPLIFLAIAINLVFLRTKTNFARVLPIFSREPSEIAAIFPRYGLWLGDMLPFAFIKIKDKKLPYLTIGITGTWLFINLVVLLGVAIYGDALKTVSDLLIHIAGFNQLSKDVGRTEWTNLLAVLTMSIISLAFSYFGAISACKRAFKTDAIAKCGYPLAILFSILLIPSAQTITDFGTGKCGYVMFALAISLPILLVLTFLWQRKRYPAIHKLLDDEYLTDKQQSSAPNSNTLGVLDGFKRTNDLKEQV